MTFDISVIGDRLREERVRLGLTQLEIAEQIGIRREMWSRYERGDAAPGGDALAGFVAIGGDAQYVLGGGRSSSALAKEEEELLEGFRGLDIRGKARVLGVVDGLGMETPETIASKPSRLANKISGIGQVTGKKAQVITGKKARITVGRKKNEDSES